MYFLLFIVSRVSKIRIIFVHLTFINWNILKLNGPHPHGNIKDFFITKTMMKRIFFGKKIVPVISKINKA